jgi:hypothetical protein
LSLIIFRRFSCHTGFNTGFCVLRRSGLLLLVMLLVGCSPVFRSGDGDRLDQRRSQQLFLKRCRMHQQQLPLLLQRFEQAQQHAALIARERYVPAPAPPALNPDEQRSLTIYDQQTEQALYNEAVAAWRRSEQALRQSWQLDHQERQKRADQAQFAAAQALQRIDPQLLLPGDPPRLADAQVERYRLCVSESLQ